MIVRGIARRSRTWIVDGVGSIEDALAKQRGIRLQELRQSASDASVDERVKLQDDLIEAVDEENRSLSGEIGALKKELEEASAERIELESSISALEYDRDYHRRSAIEAEQRARQLSNQRAILSHLRNMPESLSDIIEVIERVWADRIVFTERAKTSAQKASISKARAELPQAWKCIWAMATDLHDLLFQSDSSKGNIPQEFRARTGFEITFTEGKQTKQDKKFMRLRRDMFRGREVDITAHVKYGNTAPRCLRVHFCPLHDEKVIVVGHCGDHLDTYGTQWLQ
jgi:cell division protein FtsB